MRLKDLEGLLNLDHKMKLVVAAADEENVLEAVDNAYKRGIIEPLLVGNKENIKNIANNCNIDISSYEIVNANTLEDIAKISVQLVHSKHADFIIKGLIDTSILLTAVLNKEYGLTTGKSLSHVMIYDVQSYHKLLFLTDGGVMTYPDLNMKIDILHNAVTVLKALKYKEYKVACLAAKEKVSKKMPSTIDGDILKNMYLSKEFEDGVIVEGPISLDLAVSSHAAMIKGYKSPVAGDADILLMPNIEMGNGVGKSLTYFANAINAGVIVGASAPIVLVSRSDSYEAKYYSILLGAIISQNS